MMVKAIGSSTFKASRGWCLRYLKRHVLSLRARIHIGKKLSAEVEVKCQAFSNFDGRKLMDVEFSQIGNMEETPMFFEMPGVRGVSVKGEKTVSVKTTGNEKNYFTVILTCPADGNTLSPAVSFKR